MKTKNKKNDSGLYIENLLYTLVKDANKTINGDGCSIFLKEEDSNKYVLRESTVLTKFLGNYTIEVEEKEKEKNNIGTTKAVIIRKEPIIANDLKTERTWSLYKKSANVIKKHSQESHCELSTDKLESFLGIPLINKEKDVVGVIRVVRRKDSGPFTNDNQTTLTAFVNQHLNKIHESLSLSRLIEMGSMLDIKELCSQATDIMKRMFNAKGCSIFLSDECSDDNIIKYRCFGTTGLYYGKQDDEIGPRHIEDPYNEAVYEFKEEYIKDHTNINSLTIATIARRENLIIEDLQTYDAKKELNIRREKGSGLYSEIYWDYDNKKLIPTEADVYIPLFFTDRFNKNIPPLGVVRINKPKGTGIFKDTEIRGIISFSEKLSKTIMNSKFMSLLNETFPSSGKEVSFKKLLKQTNEFVGSQGCSLFVYDNKNECLKLRATHGNLENNKDGIIYELGEGYTGWIGKHKEPLMFNNPKELKSRRYITPCPTHSGKNTCESLNTPPPRFLGVPILGANNILLGVLRTAKTRADTEFTRNHLMIFESIATKLSPIVESINTVESLIIDKNNEFKNVFSEPLITCCNNLEKSIFKKHIEDFFSVEPQNRKPLSLATFDSIRNMWKGTKNLKLSNIDDILKNFKFFNEKFLDELPFYRDHFIHQYQVFLLGCYIIEKLQELDGKFFEKHFLSLRMDGNNGKNKKTLTEEELIEKELAQKELTETAWLITSTFHDIAYPIEKLQDWFNTIFNKYFDIGNRDNENILFFPIEKIFTYTKKKKYLSYIDELITFCKDIQLVPDNRISDLREYIYSEACSKDHGVLAALILMSMRGKYMKEIILPSSLSIALHKNLGSRFSNIKKLDFNQFPLLFMLRFCDTIHEWGREKEFGAMGSTKDYVKLKEIIIEKGIDKLSDFNNYIPSAIKRNKNTVFVMIKIELNAANYKIEECKQLFTMIESKDPYFCILVNDEFIGSCS